MNKYIFETWEIPIYKKIFWNGKNNKYCLIIPVKNEGHRILKFLKIL